MIISDVYNVTSEGLILDKTKKDKTHKFNFSKVLSKEFDKIVNTYIVKKGDTLTKIVEKEAHSHGMILTKSELISIVKKIANDNNITDPDLIYPGQKIFLNLSNISRSFKFPVNGIITSKFGMRVDPITKKIRFHEGVDIAAPIGTPVKSVMNGEVIYSGWMRGYGNIVIIKNGNLETKYAHNSELLVKKGDVVRKGRIIAKVGSTGRSTGAHLHFEVVINNKHIDPLKFLKS